MRNRLLVAVIIFSPVVLLLFFYWQPGVIKMPPAGEQTNSQAAAISNALATANPQVTAGIVSNFAAPPPQKIFYSASAKTPVAPAGKPAPLEYTNLPPDVVMDKIRHVIHDYDSMLDGNPVGVNSEITSQLSGQNPKQANFIDPESGMRQNAQGELVDPWGTPYFFHQLSAHEMEIRSAGPDKKLWTADDLVTK